MYFQNAEFIANFFGFLRALKQAVAKSVPKTRGGTKILVWATRPLLKPSTAPILVCSLKPWNEGKRLMGLVRCRQEVPLYRGGLDSRSYPHWQGHLHQDDPHHHHPQRLSALHPQVPCVQTQCLLYSTSLTTVSLLDRYEKRHKNLAAHVSPAFRVELGDVVTVGMFTFPVLRVH
jgi:hypothetical protein